MKNDEDKRIKTLILEWATERLSQAKPAFIRLELDKEAAALQFRKDQINKRLFEIEVQMKCLNVIEEDPDMNHLT
jgi:hypothetical protein